MTTAPYLIAFALIEKDGKRSMPLGGKSISEPIDITNDPANKGKEIALELLLRVFQASEECPIQKVAGDMSLLIAQMPVELMQERLPLLKTAWVNSGDTKQFLKRLDSLSNGLWRMNFVRYEGINYTKV